MEAIQSIRHIARVVVEAATPLTVGSGNEGITLDRLIARDINGLPTIPGSSLAGVLRSAMSDSIDKVELNMLFGYQEGDKGEGSRVIVSNAYFVGKGGFVFEGLNTPYESDAYCQRFEYLPIRQHVSITHRGAAKDMGKFDEELLFKGTRFCFELEALGVEPELWLKLLDTLANPKFRVGSGTRKGFGELKVITLRKVTYNLTNREDADRYINKTASMNAPLEASVEHKKVENRSCNATHYQIKVIPEDFFLFSSGLGSDEADMNPVFESIVNWTDNEPKFIDNQLLIPATSLKGALAHRTAFYFNKRRSIFAEKVFQPNGIAELLRDEAYLNSLLNLSNFDSTTVKPEELVTTYNPAVMQLFGFSLDSNIEKMKQSQKTKMRGRVIFSDVFTALTPQSVKILNHVKIDRFTGGAYEGALFNEEVVGQQQEFTFDIYLEEGVENEFVECLELAMLDVTTGALPLGGGTMRGHGRFNGKLLKDGKEINNEALHTAR